MKFNSLKASLLFKNIFIIFIFTLIAGCPANKGKIKSIPASKIDFQKLTIAGDNPKSGLFDISVEYDNAGIGWMSYSRVEIPRYVETKIAKSTDQGKTWRYVSTVNKSHEGFYKDNDEKLNGVWRSETSSLLFDPTDTPSRRWKIFSQRYPTKPPYKNGSQVFYKGWVEYKTAANPEGPWSPSIRLFGKKETNSRINLSSLHPDLKHILWYNEIGSISVNGVIYLSLDASPTKSGLGDWKKRKVILVSSKDHGKSWRYAGTLTDYNDASNLGYFVFTGSSLVKKGNRLYLLITPSGAKGLFTKNRGHDGTMVVEITDITRAKLKRDNKGQLEILSWIKPTYTSGGLSDYDEKNTQGGILFSQINLTVRSKNTDFFQVYNTGEDISY